jgi:hypothetical protein
MSENKNWRVAVTYNIQCTKIIKVPKKDAATPTNAIYEAKRLSESKTLSQWFKYANTGYIQDIDIIEEKK